MFSLLLSWDSLENVAEHKLNIRLSIGAITLFNGGNGNLSNSEKRVICGTENKEIDKPIKEAINPVFSPTKTIKAFPTTGVIFIEDKVEKNHNSNSNKKQK